MRALRGRGGFVFGLLLAACLAGSLGGCRMADAEPAGGREGGIGGTGVLAGKDAATANEEDERGIGGTGVVAGNSGDERGIGGTGIIGTITGFGSILVNGLTVEHAPDLAVAIRGGVAGPAALRVGHVVIIEATARPGEAAPLVARRLAVRHEVAGPITRLDAASGEIEVMGQTVRLPGDQIAGLAIGRRVEVSGLRRADNVIAATRVDSSPPGTPDRVFGRVSAVDADGFRIGALRIAAPAAPRANIVVGSRVEASGVSEDGRLRAARLRRQHLLPFAGRVRRLSIEGFVAPARGGRDYRLGGYSVAIERAARMRGLTQAETRSGRRVVMEGGLDHRGHFAVRALKMPHARFHHGLDGWRPRVRDGLSPRRHRPPPSGIEMPRARPGLDRPRRPAPGDLRMPPPGQRIDRQRIRPPVRRPMRIPGGRPRRDR